MAELDTAKFEEFISAYPIYEYRILDTSDLSVKTRVRQICKQNVNDMEVHGPVLRRSVHLRSAKKRSAAMERLCFFPVLQRFQIL